MKTVLLKSLNKTYPTRKTFLDRGLYSAVPNSWREASKESLTDGHLAHLATCPTCIDSHPAFHVPSAGGMPTWQQRLATWHGTVDAHSKETPLDKAARWPGMPIGAVQRKVEFTPGQQRATRYKVTDKGKDLLDHQRRMAMQPRLAAERKERGEWNRVSAPARKQAVEDGLTQAHIDHLKTCKACVDDHPEFHQKELRQMGGSSLSLWARHAWLAGVNIHMDDDGDSPVQKSKTILR